MELCDIDVPSLRYALNSCKNSLNYSITEGLISSVSNSNVWLTNSQNTLKQALEQLISVRYQNLEAQIDAYMGVTGLILEYQTLKKENDRLDLQYQNLSQNLYHLEKEYYMVYNEAGEEKETYRMISVKDYFVEQQMNGNRKLYEENKIKMEQLKATISGSI